MKRRQPRSVLITGATGAIGSALALRYAMTDMHLILHGRNSHRLNTLADRCRLQGAKVSTKILELRDQSALRQWLEEIERTDLPELIIANAGVNCHINEDGSGENWNEVEALLDINIKAVMIMIDQLLPALRKRGYGQIALLSSLAAWHGLPNTPSYCASKAAIKAYAESLRGWLTPEGIHINLVMPGYVESEMCNEMPGPKPFLWSAERAASKIVTGLEKDRPRITFPYPLNHATWWLAMLPPTLSQRLIRIFGYHD